MRTICAVTVGRSDWGIYRPVLKAIRDEPDLDLHLVASGAHLVSDHGSTLDSIDADGFEVRDRVDTLLSADTPTAISKSMALGTLGFADVFQRARPDILLLLGDRFEMHAAAVAAIPFQMPMAHIHGGELSEGAIDDALRHAITKYSHLHFTSTLGHAQRIMQLGEEPWRVTVSGAPSLDNLTTFVPLNKSELADRVGMALPNKPLLVCYHPVTLQADLAEQQTGELLAAIASYDGPIVITRPNADLGNSNITRLLAQFAENRSGTQLIDNLGTKAYFSLMQASAAMIGNSSSGIIEAASFRLPVVNIGLRQSGRAQSGNIINVACQTAAISQAIQQALSDEFCHHVQQISNIYGDGTAAAKIVLRLKTQPLGDRLLIKKFCDIPVNSDQQSQAA
ncbi:MAG: UDP-N-acetylglucosamine 2-epimerase [Pirellulales bacterium]|nr:UDP-N-acetylglucosamine 2-epimerase [Pirellulales bacterium]